jgi:hypothetical protein
MKQVAVSAINDTLLVATLACFVGIFVSFFIRSKDSDVLAQKMSKEERYEQEFVEEILSEM